MTAPVVLEWRNLNLIIKKREFKISKCKTQVEEKRILENVSGSIKSGDLVAILGPSGAGKTTLLASISQRFRGPLTGRVLINGNEVDRKTMTNVSCFVPQFEVTIGTLTPTEHLIFMAELRLDRKWDSSRKRQRVEFLLRELSLLNVANNRISTLSGGERKKLNLASDLLTNPLLMFCDEITTGLDSYNARTVIGALKYLSNSTKSTDDTFSPATNEADMLTTSETHDEKLAKAILCTIHQPTSETFQCFSHIILLYHGRCVFQGKPQDAIAYFSKLGFDLPRGFNPADFYLKILSNTSTDDESEYQTFFQRPIEILRKSNHFEPPCIESNAHFNANEYKIKSAHWFGQIWLLILRSMLIFKRSYREIFRDLAWYTVPFFIMAFLYHDSTGHTQDSIRDVNGAFFLITCELIFTQSYAVMNYYPSQLPILRRETNENIYKLSAYYVAEIFNSIPICVLRAFSGFTILYLWAGFNTGLMLYMQIGVTLIISAFTANAYGLFISSFFDVTVTELACVSDLIFLCFSGIYINLNTISSIRFVSPFFFANEALSILFWSNVSQIDCPSKLEGKCLTNGTEVLQSFSYKTETKDLFFDYLGLLILALIMHIVAFIGIKRNTSSVGFY